MSGITLRKGAVNRWVLAHHERAGISLACNTMAGRGATFRTRNELDQARIRRDENQIVAIVNTISAVTNPFSYEGNDLVNIVSGIVAPKAVKHDLLNDFNIGKNVSQQFCMDRLVTDHDMDFLSKIKTLRLKTFSSTGKKSLKKLKSESVSLKATGELFSHLLMIGQHQKIDLKDLMSHALTTIPPSIGTFDGLSVKTDKCTLMHAIEKVVSSVNGFLIPSDSAVILDGMAILQTVQGNPSTFGSLADQVLWTVIGICRQLNSKRVDFVVDRYPQISIKNCERERRASTGLQVIEISRADQKAPKQYKKYLVSGKNKEFLAAFLFAQWRECDARLLDGIELYVTHEAECHRLAVIDGRIEVT